MSKHNHYRELCALAALGEIPPEQAQELEEHIESCQKCRHAYAEFSGIHASLAPMATNEDIETIEALRAATRARVLESTVQAGANVRLEPRKYHGAGQIPTPAAESSWNWVLITAALLLIIGSFWAGVGYQRQWVRTTSSVVLRLPPPGVPSTIDSTAMARIVEPASTTDPPTQHIDKDIEQLNRALELEKKQFEQVSVRNSELEGQLAQKVQDLQSTQTLLLQKTTQLEQLQQNQNVNTATVVALNYEIGQLRSKVNEQTEQLGREREMLSSGREIRDIIGARNLHIVDVYDTDAKGRTKKPFARAFYTEGRSLVFYAYDLPLSKPDSSAGEYVAWGEKNGRKVSIKNLGILINDDQGQKRWVLNFSDPKVLAEIDSVFITLEPSGREATAPSGKRMLTAYLNDQVNHP